MRQLTKKELVLKQNRLAYAPFLSNTESENKNKTTLQQSLQNVVHTFK